MQKKELNHPNIKFLRQHGFLPQGFSGDNQIVGRCPFCEEDKKFYVNYENKRWDCKSCGEKGGYQKFLQKIMKFAQDNLTEKRADKLAERRGLKVDTIYHHKVGFNPINKTYLIPLWDVNHEELYDIKIYKKVLTGDNEGEYKDLISTAGAKTTLYGWEDLEHGEACNDIWLMEGHWDKMAMWEVLNDLEKFDRGHLVAAVPGADQFKKEWCAFFKHKFVHVVYDNDHTKEKGGKYIVGAGFRGAHKVLNYLQGIADRIDFVHWPKDWKDGFDFSDYYTEKKKGRASKTFKGVCKLIKEDPPEPDIPDDAEDVEIPWDTEEKKNNQALTGSGLSPEEVYDGYQKWLTFKDPTVIDLIFGSIFANRLPGHPLWMLLVGPSSSGKSELIMSLEQAPKIYPVSTLTTKTLVSGTLGPGGSDPSLAARIDGYILAIKDLTEILTMYSKDSEAIFSQLRNLWDGTAVKPFGTGTEKHYECKFGMLCGVTEAVDYAMADQAALGERYIRVPLYVDRSIDGERDIMWKAIDNANRRNKDKMQAELKEVANACLNWDFGYEPKVPNRVTIKMMALSQLISRLRTTVKRNPYNNDITEFASPEMPIRMLESLNKLLKGITIFRRKRVVGPEEYDLLKKVALICASRKRNVILKYMYRMRGEKEGFTEGDFAKVTKLSATVCKVESDALNLVGLVNKIPSKRAMGYDLQLSKNCLRLIREADLFTSYR